MKTIIHVNRHKVKAGDESPLTVKTYKGQKNAKAVYIKGPSEVIYRPNKPLSCGAKVWIETNSEVIAL